MWRAAAKKARRGLITTSAFTTVVVGSYYYYKHPEISLPSLYSRVLGYGVSHAEAAPSNSDLLEKARALKPPPTRAEMLGQLKSSNTEPFDLLIVGGGATGAGVALDAATRGIKTALVEREDFGAGTSSRSTKLIHGGFRYLEKAILNLDREQYHLVVEALHERMTFLQIAPHLSYEMPIMVPVYKWWQVPYYWAGCKCYDLFAGRRSLSHSYFLTAQRAIQQFPTLRRDGLKAALVYHDGMHNDARMNVALATTAVENGAIIANHVEVVALLKDPSGKVNGAKVKDVLTGETWDIKAKGVINATGPYCDGLRQMDEPANQEIVAPSAGVHVILPDYYSSEKIGLIDPKTEDGRVLFLLPWEGKTIAGTTDTLTTLSNNPTPTEDDVTWVLNAVRRLISPDVPLDRSDVLAAWAGIRPLVRDPAAKNSQSIVRNHMINISSAGLLTIAGGKWTTYRHMAEETVDAAIKHYNLKTEIPCQTKQVKLTGADGWTEQMYIHLIQIFGIDREVAQHLAHNYGGRSFAVLTLDGTSEKSEKSKTHSSLTKTHRLATDYPFLEGEVRYAVRHEYATTAVDMVARRIRLAFLDVQAAYNSLPRIVEIMAQELRWSKERKQKELENASTYLNSMGLSIVNNARASPAVLA